MKKLSSNDIIRNNVRYYRVKRGITQKQMAEYLNLDYKYYAHLENGHYQITLSNLDIISEVLEKESWELLKERHSYNEVPSRVDVYRKINKKTTKSK